MGVAAPSETTGQLRTAEPRSGVQLDALGRGQADALAGGGEGGVSPFDRPGPSGGTAVVERAGVPVEDNRGHADPRGRGAAPRGLTEVVQRGDVDHALEGPRAQRAEGEGRARGIARGAVGRLPPGDRGVEGVERLEVEAGGGDQSDPEQIARRVAAADEGERDHGEVIAVERTAVGLVAAKQRRDGVLGVAQQRAMHGPSDGLGGGDGDPRVAVDLPKDEGLAVLHFLVRDTGIGVPAAKREEVFESFSQADTSTTRKYGGTGLGLAVSAMLVELMGGRIWVDSEEGRGSDFHFTVPVGIGEEVSAKPELQRVRDSRTLIVDDNRTNRRILEHMLAEWGMTSDSVEGASLALERLEQARHDGRAFELVLLDRDMPDMDGFDLAERIRSQPDLVGCSVMMLSAGGRSGDITRCRELGVAAHLTKPVTHAELWTALASALNAPLAAGTGSPGGAEGEQLPEREPVKILLAEDNAINRKLAVGLLEDTGSVDVAANGAEALQLLEEKGPFDVILMDVQMPEIDGLAATVILREREKQTGEHTYVIGVTAHASSEDRASCLKAGMDAFISKPYRPDTLLEAIAQAGQSRGNSFDEAGALARANGDRVLLAELVRMFLADCPQCVRALHDAVEANEASLVLDAAHSLKGAMANFTDVRRDDAVYRLERMGRDGELSLAKRLSRVVEKQIGELAHELREWLSTQAERNP